MDTKKIIKLIPYSKPFLFVDEIIKFESGYIKGHYTFPKNAEFYKGHFVNRPVTPGVLLTECAAQIGLVCYSVLKFNENNKSTEFAMTSTEIDFLKPHFPGEIVYVEAEEIYYRFQKLKMKVCLTNSKDEILARGKIAGMPIQYSNEQ